MKWWQTVVNVLGKAYMLLLHGRNVGGINWPDQNQSVGDVNKGQPHDPSFPDTKYR